MAEIDFNYIIENNSSNAKQILLLFLKKESNIMTESTHVGF